MTEFQGTDAMTRHLALLLSVADLSARLDPREDEGATVRDLLSCARVSARADRASLFEVHHADADDDGALWVVRLGRAVEGDDGVDPVTPFQPRHAALLLAPMSTGATEAFGPIRDDEPFYARHRTEEPTVTRHAAFAPVMVGGQARGVLELGRSSDRPFEGGDLLALEASARLATVAVYGARREATIKAWLTSMLPEVLLPDQAATSLPERVEAWLSERALPVSERRAIALAASIADLSASSPAGLELAQTVLAAARRAFCHDVPSWSVVSRAR